MKKNWFYLIALTIIAGMFSACDNGNKDDGPDVKSVATVSMQDLTGSIASMYAEWEKNTTIPTSLEVAGKNLTQPQYQYALCVLVKNLTSGKTSGNVDVLNYKAADHPDRDSYDAETIAVTGEESVDAVASKMLQAMKEKGQVPNQTLFIRNGQAIAFSTNRATVTLARTVAAYKNDGKLPGSVSTEYLSASASLLGFAEQFVSYLDVWQKTVGTVSADGSHCTDNGTAWENVHFIPIPYSGGAYADGADQYDPKYQPYHTITVAGTEYTAAQCFIIAAKGFLDLVTKEGSALIQTERNTPVHNLGNGKSLREKIPAVEEWAIWGSYPWYEKADEPCGVINFSDKVPCDLAFMARTLPWFIKRAQDLGHIGNFLNYDEDPNNSLVMPPYCGIISPMRTFLILCRFYKHLLDNNITENVYDAVKDIKLDYDFYGIEMPDIELKTKEVNLKAAGETTEASFVAKKSWTATASADWISVSPASGDAAAPAKVQITVQANTGGEREGAVLIKGGNVNDGLSITVKQAAYAAPSGATVKDFAEQYVTLIGIWEQTTGTINMITGETPAEAGSEYEEFNVQNAHYIPSTTKVTIKDKEYNTADIFELALRSYLLLRGYDGNYTQKNGVGNIPAISGTVKMSETELPLTHGFKWGSSPYNETKNNNGHLVMGSDENGMHCKVKIDWLDNFAMRNVNFAFGNENAISNLSGYVGRLEGYYGCACAMRALITYAFFFKYMLDNKLEDAKDISADQIFRTELFGDEQ